MTRFDRIVAEFPADLAFVLGLMLGVGVGLIVAAII